MSADKSATVHTVSESVADFIEKLPFITPPEPIRRSVRQRLADTVGVGIAACTTPIAETIGRATQSLDPSSGSAVVWGTGRRLGPAQAALVNAAAVHAEDFDDTHTAGVVHGSACVVPAAWAAAESRDLAIADVHRGVLAGWEVAGRLGVASAGAFHRRGLHTTSVAGVFGAAAAACAVWKLPRDQAVAALGLAGSASAGLNAYLQDGTQGKLLNPGFAAQAGLQAAALGEGGVSGPRYVFEGRLGVFAALGEGPADLGKAFSSLGNSWEIERVSTKPYPICHFAHATVDAALDMRRAGLRAEQIDSIVCRLPEATWDLLCRPWEKKLDPDSVYAVRFSIPWLVALALIDGGIARDTFHPGLLARDDVRLLAAKVTVEVWGDSPYPATFPGSVSIRTAEGHSLVCERLINRGHPDEPLSDDELRRKFADCLSLHTNSSGADALYEALNDQDASVRDISKRLTFSG